MRKEYCPLFPGIWCIEKANDTHIGYNQPSGDLRFANFSDVTTTLNKHARNQFASGHPLLDSRLTDQVASEAVFWTKTGVH